MSYAPDRTALTVEERLAHLEEEVEILRRALSLALVGARPAVDWMDDQIKALDD